MIFQLTKTKKGAFVTTVNIMWIFNCAKHLPVYYRLMPGSKDVSAFKFCVEDSRMRRGVAIIDRGFQSASNIEKLEADKIMAEGNKIAATCSYAVAWLKRHPEYQLACSGPAACSIDRQR